MVNYINGFIPDIATKVQQLKAVILDNKKMKEIDNMNITAYQKRKLKDSIKTSFNKEALDIIDDINRCLTAVPLLHHIDNRKTAGAILLKVDTSLIGTGATIWQYRGSAIVLCRIYSRALNSAQMNYSATEREAVGLILAVERFKKVLLNKHFIAITDHKSLLQIFGIAAHRTKNYKLIRFKWRLSQYTFSIIHISGKSVEIVLEDYLSRYAQNVQDAQKLREHGIKVELDNEGSVINPYRSLNNINVNDDNNRATNIKYQILQDFDLQLLEVIGYQNSESIHIELGQSNYGIQSQLFSLDLDEYIAGSQTTVIYNIDSDENNHGDDSSYIIDQGLAVNDNKMVYFQEVCDIINLEKNIKSKNPLKCIANINYQNDTLQYLDFDKFDDLRDLYLVKMMVQRLHDNTFHDISLLTPSNYHHNIREFKTDLEIQKLIELLEVHKPPHSINMVETRAKAKIRLDEEHEEIMKKFKFRTDKTYILEAGEGDIFHNNANPLLSLYDTQKLEYVHIINYLISNDLNELEELTFNEKAYKSVVVDGKINVNNEGLLVYENRYLIPAKMRCDLILYYHTTAIMQHRGEKVMIDEFRKRFYWIGMNTDIKTYVAQCPCRAAKMNNKRDAGFKDKGYQSVFYALKQNEICYMDLYGALPDGNYSCTIIDGFDGYSVSSALRPLYNIDALGIIKFVIFEYIWPYGLIGQLITDNGSNLAARLNRIFGVIFGIKRCRIFSYSPWVNGKVESTMKGINQAIWIESTRRQINGFSNYRKMIGNALRSKDYQILIKSANLINNNTIKEGTGYSPRDLRIVNGCNILMDIYMKLDKFKQITLEKYVENGIVDYDKFKKMMLEHGKFILKNAKLNKLKSLNDKRYKNDAKYIKSRNIKINDYVIYKRPFKNKKINPMEYGWVVIDIKRKRDKEHYVIKNIFNDDILETNKGHISRFHQPLLNPQVMIQNEVTRLIDYDYEDKIL